MRAAAADLVILATGQGWLAIDKPSGLSVHNDPDSGDAISLALERLTADAALARACGAAEAPVIHPVHRLDRETSGVLLLATRREVASRLQSAIEARTAKKFYRAVLHGRMAAESGVWSDPLTDRAEGRRDPAGPARDRKACETRFVRLRQGEHLSEIEVELITGRTHQIRRHAVLHRHSLVGDTRYGEPRAAQRIESLFGVRRLLLHARRLELEDLAIESAVPEEFARVFLPPAKTPPNPPQKP